jgi:isoamyl acetate esterase
VTCGRAHPRRPARSVPRGAAPSVAFAAPSGTRPTGPQVLALSTLLALTSCGPVAKPHAAARVPGTLAPETIVFVGDSLVHRSNQDHGLLAGIRQDLSRRHPGRSFELVDAGVNGDRIAEIRDRLEQDVLQRRPAAVVLYWDSDVSDTDEARMKPADVGALRAAYERNLDDVLQRLAASGAHVIVSGPTVIGERPHGKNAKDAQLDAYRSLNREACARLGLHYADTRRAFLRSRPADANASVEKGLLTEDGEHLNDRGTQTVRRIFRRALEAWVTGRQTTPVQPAQSSAWS